MLVFCNVVVRFAALLWAALIPMLAPLDVRPVTHPSESLGRIVASVVALLLVLGLTGWSARRTKLGAALLVSCLILDAVLCFVFIGDRGPLGRGVVYLTLPLWIALALVCSAFASRWLKTSRIARPRNAALGGAILGLTVLALALPRIQNRGALWATVLHSDPGNEVGARYVATTQTSGARSQQVLRDCALANPAACTCVGGAMDAALVEGHAQDAIRYATTAGPACAGRSDIDGLRAEALFKFGLTDAGFQLAGEVLTRDANEPHALYTYALGYASKGDSPQAALYARRAVDAGRGAPAQLLLASLLIAQNDLDGASTVLKDLLQKEPQNASARYDQALIADRLDHYHDAREGYLAALQLDPKMVDARYNLVLLTLRGGFKPEAKHHLEKLMEIAPQDPRIPSLEQQIANTPDKAN